MIPTLSEWRSWKTIDKATYFAQLIAPVTLLISSVFSYLSWTEARYAREVQEKFFAAEKGPKIAVAHARMISVSDGQKALSIDSYNSGDTAADDFCVSVRGNDLKQIAGTCGDTGPLGHMALDRLSSFVYILPISAQVRKAIGFVPRNVMLVDLNKDQKCRGKYGANLIITSSFKDIVGRRGGGVSQLILCS